MLMQIYVDWVLELDDYQRIIIVTGTINGDPVPRTVTTNYTSLDTLDSIIREAKKAIIEGYHIETKKSWCQAMEWSAWKVLPRSQSDVLEIDVN